MHADFLNTVVEFCVIDSVCKTFAINVFKRNDDGNNNDEHLDQLKMLHHALDPQVSYKPRKYYKNVDIISTDIISTIKTIILLIVVNSIYLKYLSNVLIRFQL